MTLPKFKEVDDYRSRARQFLAKGRERLAAGELHQASESGWGAAAHMAKAVTETQGWVYEKRRDFVRVMNRAFHATGNGPLRDLRAIANDPA